MMDEFNRTPVTRTPVTEILPETIKDPAQDRMEHREQVLLAREISNRQAAQARAALRGRRPFPQPAVRRSPALRRS